MFDELYKNKIDIQLLWKKNCFQQTLYPMEPHKLVYCKRVAVPGICLRRGGKYFNKARNVYLFYKINFLCRIGIFVAGHRSFYIHCIYKFWLFFIDAGISITVIQTGLDAWI